MWFLHVFPFNWGWGWSEPWGWLSALISLLITVIIISVFVKIIIRIIRGDSYCHHHRHHGRWDDIPGQDGSSSEAKRILDERYAKGEISEEEYKKMKENLK